MKNTQNDTPYTDESFRAANRGTAGFDMDLLRARMYVQELELNAARDHAKRLENALRDIIQVANAPAWSDPTLSRIDHMADKALKGAQ